MKTNIEDTGFLNVAIAAAVLSAVLAILVAIFAGTVQAYPNVYCGGSVLKEEGQTHQGKVDNWHYMDQVVIQGYLHGGQNYPPDDSTLAPLRNRQFSFFRDGAAVTCTSSYPENDFTEVWSGCTFDEVRYSFDTLDDTTPDRGKGAVITFRQSSERICAFHNPDNSNDCWFYHQHGTNKCIIRHGIADNDDYVNQVLYPPLPCLPAKNHTVTGTSPNCKYVYTGVDKINNE